MKILSASLAGILACFAFSGCKHKADISVAPPKPPVSVNGCSPDTVYFRNTVYPLILSGCAKSGCHDQATHREDLTLDNYQSIRNLATPFDPQDSKLYEVLFSNEGERMPPDNPFSTEQKSIIYWWISQGALDNHCDSAGCDSANVTYAATISPIIQTWCLSCHSGSSPSGGISLAAFSDVSAVADNGKLMGSIRHSQGYSPMPPGGSQLSPCEIALIQKWINIGKP